MSPTRLCRLTQATALAGLVVGAAAMGLFGLHRPGAASDLLGGLSALLLIVALGLLRQLAQRRQVQLPEFEGALLESAIVGLVFLAAVYHFSGLVPFFGPVRVALDQLMPVWADHVLGLAPGLALVIAAEAILRRPPPKRDPEANAHAPSPPNSKEAKNGKL